MSYFIVRNRACACTTSTICGITRLRFVVHLALQFEVPTEDPPFSISATELSGDIEIYVSNRKGLDGNVQLPYVDCKTRSSSGECTAWEVSHYEWSSTETGSRHLIELDSSMYGQGNVFVIGVLDISHTWLGSDFSITATTSTGIATLEVGVPSRGQVQPNQYTYYRAVATANGVDLGIYLTTISGDPDVYADLTNSRPTKYVALQYALDDSLTGVCCTGRPPSTETHTWIACSFRYVV